VNAALSQQRRAEVRARLEATTPGEWTAVLLPPNEHHKHPVHWVKARYEDGTTEMSQVVADCPWRQSDAEFIAHARQDVPALLAEVERLQAEVAEQRRYTIGLEAAVCQCQPACENGEYLHEADCPVVLIQMNAAGLAKSGVAS
jgi:hypothetical protein